MLKYSTRSVNGRLYKQLCRNSSSIGIPYDDLRNNSSKCARLPIPELNDTINRYLHSIYPMLNNDKGKMEKHVELIENVLKGQIGEDLYNAVVNDDEKVRLG